MKTKKILVIGATGFIGKHLVKALSEKNNYSVKCLARNESKPEDINYLKKTGASVVYGDLDRPETIKGISEGIDCVFYLAGGGNVSSLSKKDMEKLEAYNLDSLKKFLNSVKKIRKIIFFSSVSAMGVKPGKIADENIPCTPVIPHELCKYKAEQLIKEFAKTKKYDFSILRPSIVFGEFSFGDSFNFIKMVNKGHLFLPGNGKNVTPWVYVENVVNAAILLINSGDNQEYIINQKEDVTFNRIISDVSLFLHKKTMVFHIPVIFLVPLVYIQEKLFMAFGKSPVINMYRLKSMTSDRRYSIKKIESIGYSEKINFEHGLEKTLQYYKENGSL
jgi:farnesol dehydrogenase